VKITPHSNRATALDAAGDGLQLLDPEQHVLRCCRVACELEDAGDYEAECEVLSEWWQTSSQWPRTDGLGAFAAGELLLRVAALVGGLGLAKQPQGAQAHARKLAAESILRFKEAGQKMKVAEARAELGWCRRNEGDFEGARELLQRALDAFGDDADGHRAKLITLLRAAVVEDDSGKLTKAYDMLRNSAPLFDSCDSLVLRGRFHNNRGIVLNKLGEESGREDYIDRALIEHAGASSYFEKAGAKRLLAHSENNRGLLYLLIGKFDEATACLERALRLFKELNDAGHAAEVKETRARGHLAQNRNEEAANDAAEAVSVFEAGERHAVRAEALTTWGVALARLGDCNKSREKLALAFEVAERAGARQQAGLASLAIVEELCGRLTFEEAASHYERACSRLAGTRSARTQQRLIEAARKIFEARRVRDSAAGRPAERAGEVAVAEAPSLWAALRSSGDNTPGLITGTSAEARRLWARRAHELSGRRGRFIAVDCDALEDESYEAEVFCRLVREAEDDTLFIDEVQGSSQEHLEQLWRLDSQGIIGHSASKSQRGPIDVRVIAGTSCDLSAEVFDGCFPVELYERLRGRGSQSALPDEAFQELRVLAGCLLKDEVERGESGGAKIPQAAGMLKAPAAEAFGEFVRMLARASDAAASQGGLAPGVDGAAAAAARFEALRVAASKGYGEFKECARNIEAKFIREALEAADGKVTVAARLLGVTRGRLDYMLKNEFQELMAFRKQIVKRGRSAGGEEPALDGDPQ
jgi:tetratricopeptide (TPR) repeat protein